MPRTCYICNSLHRDEYDQMKLEGMPIIEIYAISHNKYNENFKYYHFQKHFANHLVINDKSRLENLGRLFLRLLKESKHLLE